MNSGGHASKPSVAATRWRLACPGMESVVRVSQELEGGRKKRRKEGEGCPPKTSQTESVRGRRTLTKREVYSGVTLGSLCKADSPDGFPVGPDRHISNGMGLLRDLAHIARLPSNSLVHHTIVKMKWTIFDTLSQCPPATGKFHVRPFPPILDRSFPPNSPDFSAFRPPWPESSPSPVHLAATGAGSLVFNVLPEYQPPFDLRLALPAPFCDSPSPLSFLRTATVANRQPRHLNLPNSSSSAP